MLIVLLKIEQKKRILKSVCDCQAAIFNRNWRRQQWISVQLLLTLRIIRSNPEKKKRVMNQIILFFYSLSLSLSLCSSSTIDELTYLSFVLYLIFECFVSNQYWQIIFIRRTKWLTRKNETYLMIVLFRFSSAVKPKELCLMTTMYQLGYTVDLVSQSQVVAEAIDRKRELLLNVVF